MLCFVFVLALGNRSGSLYLFLTHSLSLLVSLYSFCSGHNIDYDRGIFWDLHCLAVCCVLLLFIDFGICSFVCFTFVYQGPQY